jgi:hypothetical protein
MTKKAKEAAIIDFAYEPLAVQHEAKEISIYLPGINDDLADDSLLRAILISLVPLKVIPQYIPKEVSNWRPVQSDQVLSYLLGALHELHSSVKVAHNIKPSSEYSKGKQAMRIECLVVLCEQLKVSKSFLKLDPGQIGMTKVSHNSTTLKRELMQMFPQEGKYTNVYNFFRSLIRAIMKRDYTEENAHEKFGMECFVSIGDLIGRCKRTFKSRTTGKKGRAGQTTYVKREATKPHTLKGVAPWESEAVKEVYEAPWAAMKTISEKKITNPWKFNWNEIEEECRELVNKQWESKQKLLKALNSRLDYFAQEADVTRKMKVDSMSKFFENRRSILEIQSTQALNVLHPKNIFVVKYIDGEGFTYTNLWTVWLDHKLAVAYPHTSTLFDEWNSRYQVLYRHERGREPVNDNDETR